MGVVAALRSPKIAGVAAFDLLATAASSCVLAAGVRYLAGFDFYALVAVIFVILMASAVALHVATGTPTMLNYYLGVNTLEEVEVARVARGEDK